jgi:CBS domain containing-hemolysin-like protein
MADPDFVESACETAVTVTAAGVGTVAGALYSPLLEMLPFAVPPFTLQVTSVFVVPLTVAVNCCVFAAATVAVGGATETLMVVLGV